MIEHDFNSHWIFNLVLLLNLLKLNSNYIKMLIIVGKNDVPVYQRKLPLKKQNFQFGLN